MSVSVAINTYNASRYLREVIVSVSGFDEIVVCDMESTDDTVEIAKSLGCRVVVFPKRNFTICEPARNYAIQSCSSPWVLVVDADELVSPQLRHYLYEFIKNPGDTNGLFVCRKNFMMGKFLKSTYPDPQLRFFRKDCVDWPPTVHSLPLVNGKVGRIPQSRRELALIHLGPAMRDVIEHYNNYTDNELVKRGDKKVTFMSLITEPLFRFVKSYFFKGGIMLGKAGLIQAQKDAFYKYLTLTKLYEKEVIEDINRKNRQDC